MEGGTNPVNRDNRPELLSANSQNALENTCTRVLVKLGDLQFYWEKNPSPGVFLRNL